MRMTYGFSIADEVFRRRQFKKVRWYRHPLDRRNGPPFQLACIHAGVGVSLPSRLLSSSKDASPLTGQTAAAVSENGLDEDAAAAEASSLATGDTSEQDPMSEIVTFMSRSMHHRNRVPLKEVMAAMHWLREAVKSKNQVVGPRGAIILVKCTGKSLPDIPKAERAQMTRDIWNLLNQTGIFLDTSHYNTLLSNRLLNEDEFSPTEFLSSMEAKGVAPDRTTFGYLVARFCQMGDMTGAMAILSHMKEADMPLDTFIFHSLIMGHCKIGDYSAAKNTMKTMPELGLDVGAKTHLSYVIGMVKGGAPWEEVKVELQKAIDKEDIAFDDENILHLMHDLSLVNEKEGAKELIGLLPMSDTYLNSIRNYLPPIIFAGNVDLAMEIYDNYIDLHGYQEEPNIGNRRPHHGTFIFQALAKIEHPPEEVIEMLKRHAPTNVTLPTQMIEYCALLGKVAYAKRLIKLMKAEDDLQLFPDNKSVFQFVAFAKNMPNTEAINLFANMSELGVDFNGIKGLSKLVMPYLNLDNPMDTVVRMKGALLGDRTEGRIDRRVSYVDICNAAIRHLLSKNDLDGMHKALHCASRQQSTPLITNWSYPLADTYLITGDTDALVHFLTLADQPSGHRRPAKIKVFATLNTLHSRVPTFCPLLRADEVLHQVLDALKRRHIGLTEDAGQELLEVVRDPSTKDLILELQKLRKDSETYWTRERREQARLMASKFCAEKGLFGPDRPDQKQINDRRVNSVVDAINDIKDTPNPNPMMCMNITEKLLETNRVEEAVDLVRSLVSKGFPQFMKTVSLICIDMIKLGQYGEVEQFLKEVSSEGVKKTYDGVHSLHMTRMMDCLVSESKDAQLVEKFASTLREEKFGISQRQIASFVINVHVANKDYERAVAEFEGLMQNHGVEVSTRTALSVALIEMNDMERLHRVTDAISSKHGQDIPQYNLALCYLILGRYSEARKAMDSPGMVYKNYEVKIICSELKSRSNTAALEKFVSMTRNLYQCDRTFLYTALLESHCKNVDKLTEVLMQMQEEGVAPSSHMRGIIANTFQQEGRGDPFTNANSGKG